MMKDVLIVSNNEVECKITSDLLVKNGCLPIFANNYHDAKEMVSGLSPGAVIVTDMAYLKGSAKDLISWQRLMGYSFPVVVIVDNLNTHDLLELIHCGGVVDVVQRAAIDKQLVEIVNKYIKPDNMAFQLDNMLIPRQSVAFRRIEKSIRAIAATNTNAIIFGESGTGKEQIAKQIYRLSSRAQKPCSVIEAGGAALVGEHDPAKFRSEIYNRMEGYFKMADGGTIIIKNVQLLSFDKQSVLLHILENEHPDVRVICTAEPELLKMVSEKIFRPNLFYILRQIDITVPPLREVTEDIAPLSDYFLTRYAHSTGHDRKRLDASALNVMKVYPFPGNVRELKDVVLFAAFHASTDVISKDNICFSQSEPEPDSSFKLQDPALEKAKILAALEQVQGNKTMAAKLLRIDRTTLYVKMRQYGLK